MTLCWHSCVFSHNFSSGRRILAQYCGGPTTSSKYNDLCMLSWICYGFVRGALLNLVEPPDHVRTGFLWSLEGEGGVNGIPGSGNRVVDVGDDGSVQNKEELLGACVAPLVLDPSLGMKLDGLSRCRSDHARWLAILLQCHTVRITVHSLPTLFVIGPGVLQLLPDGRILLQPAWHLARALPEVAANLGHLGTAHLSRFAVLTYENCECAAHAPFNMATLVLSAASPLLRQSLIFQEQKGEAKVPDRSGSRRIPAPKPSGAPDARALQAKTRAPPGAPSRAWPRAPRARPKAETRAARHRHLMCLGPAQRASTRWKARLWPTGSPWPSAGKDIKQEKELRNGVAKLLSSSYNLALAPPSDALRSPTPTRPVSLWPILKQQPPHLAPLPDMLR